MYTVDCTCRTLLASITAIAEPPRVARSALELTIATKPVTCRTLLDSITLSSQASTAQSSSPNFGPFAPNSAHQPETKSKFGPLLGPLLSKSDPGRDHQ